MQQQLSLVMMYTAVVYILMLMSALQLTVLLLDH